MESNTIEYVGINTNLPENIKFFKEVLINDEYCLNKNLNNLKKIVSVSIDYDVDLIKIINTDRKISTENQSLSGKKALIELTLKYKIKYTDDKNKNKIYILKKNTIKAIYIALPIEIDNLKIEEISRMSKLEPEVFIEDVYATIKNKNSLYIRSLVLVNIKLKSI